MVNVNLYKNPRFGYVQSNELVSTPIGRLSWPSLVTPKAAFTPKPGEQAAAPKYEVTLLIDKGPELETFKKEVNELLVPMLKLFNEGRSATVSGCSIYKDGDAFDLEKYPYYKGKAVIVARNAKEDDFKCVGKNPNNLCPRDFFQGGMLVRLLIAPLVTATGLSYKLFVVQFAGDDGVRYGGGVRKDYSSLMGSLEPIGEETEAPFDTAPACPVVSQVQTAVQAPELAAQQTVSNKLAALAATAPQAIAPAPVPPAPGKVDVAALRANAAAQVQKKGKKLAIDLIS